MTTIAKTFQFDAAHCLPLLPDDHKCKRMHGHTYEVTIVLRGPVMNDGMIVDYQVIADAWQRIHDQIDHRVLNEVLTNPTTEVLAEWICVQMCTYAGQFTIWATMPSNEPVAKTETLSMIERVRVKESSTTWCEVTVDELVASGKLVNKTWTP